MSSSRRKLLLVTIGSVTAIAIAVTIVVSVVAYLKVRQTMLNQVYRDSLIVVQQLRSCALMDAVHTGESPHGESLPHPANPRARRAGAGFDRSAPLRSPLEHIKAHIASMARHGGGEVEVVDATGEVLASSHVVYNAAGEKVTPDHISPATSILIPGHRRVMPLSRFWESSTPTVGQINVTGADPEIVAIASVPELGWRIHYYQNLQDVEANVRSVTYPILCILTLVVLTVPLQAFLFIRTIVQPYALQPLEREVRAERAEADALLNAVADGIVVIGTDYQVLRTNRIIEENYGNTLCCKCYKAFFSQDEPCDICPTQQVFNTGKPAQVMRKVSGIPGNGGERWVETVANPLYDENGRLVASIEVIRDITERMRVEEMQARSARLRALGELAAGIAHEIRTPMNGVTVFLEAVQEEARRIGASEEMQHDLELIREQSNRVVGITERILSFAKEESSELELLNLNWVIERVLEFVVPNLRAHGIEVNTLYTAAFPLVLTNFDELYEVFLNLIVNAQDAMPNGGTITLQTEQDKRAAIVRVIDTGVGISPEHLTRVFEPGFSTKADQGIAKGLGLGLFLTQGIVESFGGTIAVDSSVGQGTTFTLRFPASEPE